MKELTYYVTKDGIMPQGVIEAGFAGEHKATRIVFNLSNELNCADEYYLYITNGGGEFFSSDSLDLYDDSIFYELPNYVTAISGICKLQLVLKQDDSVIFTFPCEIKILPSAEGTSGAINYLSEIDDALKICRNSAKLAQQTIDRVNDNSAEFNRIVGDIESALEEIIHMQENYIGGDAE